jgi:S-adenosyl methyltransferase
MKAVPAGSYLAMTHVASDLQQRSPGVGAAAAVLSRLMPHRVTPRSQEQIVRFFSDFDLLEPGVVAAQDWHPEGDSAGRRSAMRGGVAVKP